MHQSYSYDRRAAGPGEEAAPKYKGKALKHMGGDKWVLEGHGCKVTCEGQVGKGWKAQLECGDDRVLPGTTHGKDIEEVVRTVLHNEYTRIKGGHMRLDELEKKLDSLGGE